MNELLTHTAFKYYVVCAVALAFNPLILAGLTGGWRGKFKSPATPEDEKLSGNAYHQDMAPEVDRVLRAHRNALENIPIALIAGLLYVLVGGPDKDVLGLMGTVVVFRWLHSFCYLKSIQPLRTASFGIALLAIFAMLIHTALIVVRA